jgi:hypothetical protein
MSLKLPLLFIATGMLAFMFFQIENVWSQAAWMAEHPRSPVGWTQIHLLVLGWATMIAMGAVYQLIHVVLQRNIYSTTLGYIHYGFFFVGTFGLLLGFFHLDTAWIAGFAIIAAMGIFLFIYNTAYTLIQSKQWNPITLSTLFALFYLALTALSGVLMGLNFALDLWGTFHEALLSAHIWMGAFGWFGLLITGFSYKMLPMFYLAHNHPTRLQHVTLWLWNSGVSIGAVSFITQAPFSLKSFAMLLIILAMGTYVVQIQQIIKFRHKASPGTGILFAVWSARILLLAGASAFLWKTFSPSLFWDIKALQLFIWIYLWGWVAVTILGYMSKIVPFLWWTYKYGSQVGKKKVPILADMLKETHIRFGLTLITAAFVLLAVGLALQYTMLIQWGGALFSISSLIYIGLIAKVFIN